MALLTIVETVESETAQAEDGTPLYSETYYLNHSCMHTLSFGCEEMAWTTENEAEAEIMLQKVIETHDDESRDFHIMELG